MDYTSAKIYYGVDRTVDETNYEEMPTTCPTFTNAGNHTVYYYVVCDNYEIVKGSVEVAINKAALTVTVPDETLTYGDAPSPKMEALTTAQETTDQLSYAGFVGADSEENAVTGSAVFETAYTTNGDVGTYPITVSGLSAQNYQIRYTPGTLTVQPKTITFTWPQETTFTYNGNEQGITAEVSGKVSESDDVRVGSYTENLSENQDYYATAAGNYTAVVKSLAGAAAKNYRFEENEATLQKEWRINQAENAFTIAPTITGWTENSQANAPVAAAKYGTVTFTYSTEEEGTYTPEIPDGGAAGTYYMKATVAETANYKGLTETVPFTIKEASEETDTVTITITGKDKTVTYGDAFSVTALTEADVTITGLPLDMTIADVTAQGRLAFQTDYVTGSNAGSYLLLPSGLTAKAGYEILYQPGKITVNKKEVSLTWSESAFAYDGQNHIITASVDSTKLYSGDSIEITAYEDNEGVNAGTYTAHAISFAGRNWNNYAIKADTVRKQWSITKATATDPEAGNSFTVSPTISDWTYGETPSVATSESKFGKPHYVYASTANGSFTETVPTTAGTWYMKAIVDGTQNYDAITSEAVSFEIKKAKITVIADDISSPKGAELAELTYRVSDTVKTGDNLGIQLSTTATKNAKIGEYPIEITHNENANYEITVQNGTYFITASTVQMQVTASGYGEAYDGMPHGINVTVKDGNGRELKDAVVYYSDSELTKNNYGTGTTTSPTITDAGTKTIYYYVDSDSYEAVSGFKDVTIYQKRVTVTARDASIVYGEAPTQNGVYYSGFVGGDTAETLGLTPQYNCNYEKYQSAGKYRILPQGLPLTGNYTYDYVKGTLTVTQKPVTFQWTGNSFTFDGTTKRVTAEAEGLVNGDVLAIDYEAASAVKAGEYTAKIANLSGDKASSYVIETGEATASHAWKIVEGINYFTKNPAIESWTYGETASEPVGEAVYGQVKFLYSTTVNGTYTEEKPVKAGSYFMKARVEQTADYAMLESAPVSFQIKKAQISVMADDISGMQGDEIKELTYSVTGNQIEGEKLEVTLQTTATEESPIGSYPITVSVDASENYQVTIVAGTYHILDIDLDIKAEGVNTVYDGAEHGIHVTAENATIYYSAEKLESTAEIASQAGVSTQSPTRRVVGSSRVYYYVEVDKTVIIDGFKDITITKKELIVRAKDKEINQGEVPANDGVTYEGFVPGDGVADLKGQAGFTYDYKKGDPAGNYKITPLGLTASNYRISFVPGVLTVLPVQEEIAIMGVTKQDSVYDGSAHSGYIGTPSTEGGAVTAFTYTYQDADGNTLTEAPTNAGAYTLTISIPEDNRYYKGKTTVSFHIARAELFVKAQNQAILEGQQFSALPLVYSGFAGGDTKETIISTEAAAGLETDVLLAGTNTAIKITDLGTLTEAGSKNYTLTGVDGILTILQKKEDGDSGKPDDTGGSIKLEPDNPNSGIVQTAVIKDGEGLPRTELETNLTVEVAEALLTPEEAAAVKEGKDALIYLILSAADETISKETEAAIEETAAQMGDAVNVALFLDLSMFKKIGDSAPTKITEVGTTKVSIGITLPENLKQTDTELIRSYYIIFEHEGVTETVTPTYENGILKFAADKFSIYAIAYKDEVRVPANPDPDPDKPVKPDPEKPVSPDPEPVNPGTDQAEFNQPKETAVDTPMKPVKKTPETADAPETANAPKTEQDGIRIETGSDAGEVTAAEESVNDESVTEESATDESAADTEDESALDEMPGKDETEEETAQCFMHWLILLLALIGFAITLVLGRKRKKLSVLVLLVATVLILFLAILGSCYLDWIVAVIGILMMLGTLIFLQREKEKDASSLF